MTESKGADDRRTEYDVGMTDDEEKAAQQRHEQSGEPVRDDSGKESGSS